MKTFSIALIIIAAFVTGFFAASLQPVAAYDVRLVVYEKEIPVIKYIDRPVIIYVNNETLREFPNAQVLGLWVQNWKYEKPFVPETNDCDDFAARMFLDMNRDGYIAGFAAEVGHMKVATFMDNVAQFIEPQTGEISRILGGYKWTIDKWGE